MESAIPAGAKNKGLPHDLRYLHSRHSPRYREGLRNGVCRLQVLPELDLVRAVEGVCFQPEQVQGVSERGYIVDKCPHCAGTLRQRSTEQNAKLHALLGDIAEQKEWAGQKWSTEEWKRLIVAAWERTQRGGVTIVPGLDGHGFDVIYRRTSRMTKQELSELIEYATSWALDQGVQLHDPVNA